jgi:hypothetical protein
MSSPGYWMNETSGVLRPAVVAYLSGEQMTFEQIAAMRVYLRQWVNADVWTHTIELEELRADLDQIGSRAAISWWLDRAIDLGMDPL